MLIAVLHVAMELLQERALLLSHACVVFLSKYGGVSNPSQLYLEVGDSEVQFSFRWLLHQLIVYLHSYMKCKCIYKRFCTNMVEIFYKLSLEAKVGSVDKGITIFNNTKRSKVNNEFIIALITRLNFNSAVSTVELQP